MNACFRGKEGGREFLGIKEWTFGNQFYCLIYLASMQEASDSHLAPYTYIQPKFFFPLYKSVFFLTSSP